MSSGYDDIEVPKLVDSEILTAVGVFEDGSKNRNAEVRLLLEDGEKGKVESLSFLVSESTLRDVNYKLKVACHQIKETVKRISTGN